MLMPFNQLMAVLTSCSSYPLSSFEVPISLHSNPFRPKCPFRCEATHFVRSAHFVAQQPISPEVPISLRSDPFRT